MRKKIVAGNWKMNLNLHEGEVLVSEILDALPELNENQKVVIAPPFLHITRILEQTNGIDSVSVAAQNAHHEKSGAYTGEISPVMLKDVGVEYVIIGHSERREYNGENDALLAKKVNAALEAGLQVIFCCGEPLEVRDRDAENDFVAAQITAGLFHLEADQMVNISIAYEPIWAIGTGRTASSQQAQDMHQHIRATLAAKYGQTIADQTSILYGGSCKPSNAEELFACADVDGGLIGGASLKAEEFLAIIKAMTITE